MKTLASFILLNFVLISAGQAQTKYSNESLEKLSKEDLGLYLEKAQKQKRAGAIISVVGPVTFVSGILLVTRAYGGGTEGQFAAGISMMVLGPAVTVVGLPVLITGSSRVNRINKFKSSSIKGASIEVAPALIYNYQAHNQQPGMTLVVRF